MDTLLWVMLIVFFVFAIIAVIFIIKSCGEAKSKNEIHISGGANIDRGYLSDDNNYFKGGYNGLDETVVIGNDYRKSHFSSRTIKLINIRTMITSTIDITKAVVLGRSSEAGQFEIKGDSSISKLHCKIFVCNGDVYIEDLGSTNHTCVNSKRISAACKLNNCDVIKVGNTSFKVEL